MSVAGQCELCLTGTVEHTCGRCGGLVCTEHFDETTGFCLDCVSDAGTGREPDGTDIYRM